MQHIAKFEQEFNAKVNLSVIPNSGYTAAIQTRLQGGQVYDLYYNFAANSQKFYTLGWAKALDKLPGADQLLSDMFPSTRSHYQSPDGKLISLPYFSAVTAYFYNQSHLQKAGITAFPQTFTDLYNACKTIKSKGIAATPYTAYWTKQFTEEAWISYLLAAGVTPFDNKGAPVFADDSKTTDVLEWWLSMYQEKLTQPTILTDIIDQEVPLVANGKATFMMAEHYWLKSVRQQNGPESKNVVFSYTVPGTGNKTLYIGEILQMGSTSNTAAWDLAKFYGWKDPKSGQYSTFESWASAASLAAPYPGFFQDPVVQQGYGDYFDLSKLLVMFQSSDGVGARNLPWYPGFQVNVGDRIHAMLLGQANVAATIAGLASDAKSAASGV
jgi:multiple sugar transport system substrate-binding protein